MDEFFRIGAGNGGGSFEPLQRDILGIGDAGFEDRRLAGKHFLGERLLADAHIGQQEGGDLEIIDELVRIGSTGSSAKPKSSGGRRVIGNEEIGEDGLALEIHVKTAVCIHADMHMGVIRIGQDSVCARYVYLRVMNLLPFIDYVDVGLVGVVTTKRVELENKRQAVAPGPFSPHVPSGRVPKQKDIPSAGGLPGPSKRSKSASKP